MRKPHNITIYHHTSGITRAYEQCHGQRYDLDGTPIWWTPTVQSEWKTSPWSGWMRPFRQTLGLLTFFLAYASVAVVAFLLIASEQWVPFMVLLGLHIPLWKNRVIVTSYMRLRGPEAVPRTARWMLILQGVASLVMGVIWGLTSYLLENETLFWSVWGFFSVIPWILTLYMRYQLRYTPHEKAA